MGFHAEGTACAKAQHESVVCLQNRCHWLKPGVGRGVGPHRSAGRRSEAPAEHHSNFPGAQDPGAPPACWVSVWSASLCLVWSQSLQDNEGSSQHRQPLPTVQPGAPNTHLTGLTLPGALLRCRQHPAQAVFPQWPLIRVCVTSQGLSPFPCVFPQQCQVSGGPGGDCFISVALELWGQTRCASQAPGRLPPCPLSPGNGAPESMPLTITSPDAFSPVTPGCDSHYSPNCH